MCNPEDPAETRLGKHTSDAVFVEQAARCGSIEVIRSRVGPERWALCCGRIREPPSDRMRLSDGKTTGRAMRALGEAEQRGQECLNTLIDQNR